MQPWAQTIRAAGHDQANAHESAQHRGRPRSKRTPTSSATIFSIKDFSTGYHSRKGGSDLIIMDFDLPMIDVRPVDGPEVIKVEPTASRDMGPAQIVFEAAVAFFRRLIFCPSRCSSC